MKRVFCWFVGHRVTQRPGLSAPGHAHTGAHTLLYQCERCGMVCASQPEEHKHSDYPYNHPDCCEPAQPKEKP